MLMRICGLQKMSLLDYPEKVAATVFTGGCNFRCPFCHNSSLVLTEKMMLPEIPQQEIFTFLEKRKNKLDGICITGGEPLINEDIGDFALSIKKLGFSVKLDTNGYFPQKLKMLIQEGVIDYVAMDIKNSQDAYPATVGIADIDIAPIEESVAILMGGNVPFEFRTTVVKELHNEDNIRAIGQWISGAPKYFLQCFKDSGNLIKNGLSAYTAVEMERFRAAVSEYVPNTSIRGV